MDPEWANAVALLGTSVGTMVLARIVDKVRGLDGPHDIADLDYQDEVDPKLLEKLEQWELFWRQGCYDPSVKCPHDTPPTVEYNLWGKPHVRLDPELACERLESEFSKVYRFDALEAHTKQINEMIERSKTWTLG